MTNQQGRDEILLFCLNYIEGQGEFHPPLFPTLREMADWLDIASTNTILHHVNVLIDQGYIAAVNRSGSKSRSFGFTKAGMYHAEEVRNARKPDSNSLGSAGDGADSRPGVSLPDEETVPGS